jgi:Ca2+-binding EF-hand superfamily protein
MLANLMSIHRQTSLLATACVLSLALLSLSGTRAAESKDEQIDDRFAAADTDHDGKLTLDEAKQGMPRVAAHFAEIDKDKKGYVTADEIRTLADR